MVVVPGTNELLAVGGSRDPESDQVSGQVVLLRNKAEALLKKSLTVPRSKVALAVGRTQDHLATKNYIFAVGG